MLIIVIIIVIMIILHAIIAICNKCGYSWAHTGYLNEIDEPENLHFVSVTNQVHNFTTNSLHVNKWQTQKLTW